MHSNQITDWKNQLLAKAANVFGGESRPDEPTVGLKVLHAKIDQPALESVFLKTLSPSPACRAQSDDRPRRSLPITRRAQLVNLSRGSM